jgi:hypothetical protein
MALLSLRAVAFQTFGCEKWFDLRFKADIVGRIAQPRRSEQQQRKQQRKKRFHESLREGREEASFSYCGYHALSESSRSGGFRPAVPKMLPAN